MIKLLTDRETLRAETEKQLAKMHDEATKTPPKVYSEIEAFSKQLYSVLDSAGFAGGVTYHKFINAVDRANAQWMLSEDNEPQYIVHVQTRFHNEWKLVLEARPCGALPPARERDFPDSWHCRLLGTATEILPDSDTRSRICDMIAFPDMKRLP